MQDEGDRDVARLVLEVEQEVGVQVDFAVVFDVEARAGLEVGQVFRIGQFESEILADPVAHPASAPPGRPRSA